jgi:phage-related protein (TIGR01555 family)
MAKRPARKPSTKAQDAPQVSDRIVTGADAYTNIAARLGAGTPSLLEGSEYPLTYLTRNYMLLTSLYRSSWIARRLIDLPITDALKNWIRITSQQTPQEKDLFFRCLRKTATIAKIGEAARWGRLYGGAAAVMIIDGDEDRLEEPLDLDAVEIGSFKGLMTFDRWSGVSPSSELIDEYTNPAEHGQPAAYLCSTTEGQSFTVHSSRVLRFTGRGSLPAWQRMTEQGWGTSEIELVFDELKKRDTTSVAIANLVMRANILVTKQKGQDGLLAMGTPQQQSRLLNTITNANHLISNQSMLTLGLEESLEAVQYTFGGLGDVWDRFALDISAASEIPFSKLFGRTASGLSNTGEGDEILWENRIQNLQGEQLDPQLDKLLPVICMSTWGQVPPDFSWQWMPIRKVGSKDQAELAKNKSDVVLQAYNAGLISDQLALTELSLLAEETGMWGSISAEIIAAASDQVQMPAGESEPAPLEL